MAEIRTTQVVVDGVRSLVRSSGPHDATEAVVFLHGNPGSGEDWLDLLPHVGDFARAIAPDMPGYGKADRPSNFDYTIAGYARHLSGLLEQLVVTRVHLVMHDFGGPWGLQWASERPTQVASITLMNIGIVPGYRWHTIARIWRTPVLGEVFQRLNGRRSFRSGLNAGNPKPFPDEFVNRMFDYADAGHKRAVLALYRASDLDVFSRHVGPLLKPLSLPALVIWGAADDALPVRFAQVQQEYFRVETHVLADCGHWPMIDDPDQVRSLVLPFLRRHVSGLGNASHRVVDAPP
jgi:pimeloyl-ACP methyl ester carboxylesterase